jgi:hypothetical protein
MIIQYFEPFTNAWKRMVNALFHPFDLSKWFVVGFSAFLAGLVDGPHGNFTTNLDTDNYWNDYYDFYDFPSQAWNWLTTHPGWFFLIILGVFFLILFIILITWLSSRGEFIFLDNVVQNKAEITKPWKKYRKESNSLFIWRLFFGLFCFLAFVTSIVAFYLLTYDIFGKNYNYVIPWLPIILISFSALLFLVTTLYISMFVDNFIVPLMYKNRVNILAGWRLFLPLLLRKFGYFLLYGIVLFVAYIIIIFLVILISVFTCCIGFLILIIPYINSVALLPVSYTLRSFSVEFLEQFGEEYKIFPVLTENLE